MILTSVITVLALGVYELVWNGLRYTCLLGIYPPEVASESIP